MGSKSHCLVVGGRKTTVKCLSACSGTEQIEWGHEEGLLLKRLEVLHAGFTNDDPLQSGIVQQQERGWTRCSLEDRHGGSLESR